jgi:hypothetical protein
LCPYLFDQGDNFGRTFVGSALFCHGHHTTAMPAESKLIAYRVYLSAASTKLGKELEEKFQIMSAPSMLY